MFLSRFKLNLRSNYVLADLTEPYRMHQTVYSLFPSKPVDTKERILYRYDFHKDLGICFLYILSAFKPDWDKLDRSYLLPESPSINPKCVFFTPVIQVGSLLQFCLRANPTYKRTPQSINGTRQKGKRLALRCEVCPAWAGNPKMESCQSITKHLGGSCKNVYMWWLQRKSEAGGFKILRSNFLWEGLVQGKPILSNKKYFPMIAVQYQGVLEVTDSQRFSETLRRGIGSGKGFGFGLLTIQPAF